MIKNCAYCNKEFETNNPKAMYCKNSCKTLNYRKRNSIAEPVFLLSNKEGIGELKTEYIEVERQREVVRFIDNPKYIETRKTYENAYARVLTLNLQKKDLITRRTNFVNRNEEIIGVAGGALAVGLLTQNIWLGLLAGVAGYAIGNEVKQNRQYEILQKVRDFDNHILEYTASITNAEIVAAQIYNQLKVVSKKISIVEKENYIEKLPKLPEIKLPELEKIILLTNEEKQSLPQTKGIVSLANFKEMEFKTLEFNTGWNSIFGNPQGNFKMMVYGASGHGKSYFAARFAEYLANSHGKTLYNAAEEGINKGLQNKMSALESKYLDIGHFQTYEDLKKAIKKEAYRFVVIDSVNEMKLTPSELKELWEIDKKRGFIYIMQITKAGEFKGDNSFLHDADISVKIEDRLPIVQKNRYV